MKDVITFINKNLSKEYQFKFDLIYGESKNEKGYYTYEFLGFADSINKDFTWCSESLFKNWLYNYKNKNKINNFIRWVNNKLFYSSIKLVINNKLQCETEFVRLRIATNMIDKFDFLSKEEKLEQQDKLKEVYYARKKELIEYYSIYVAKLPFLEIERILISILYRKVDLQSSNLCYAPI